MIVHRAVLTTAISLALWFGGSDGRWSGTCAHAKPEQAKQGQQGKGPSHKSDKARGNSGQAGGPKSAAGAAAAGEGDPGAAKARWSRDWRAEDFVRAGFTVAALHELLGGNTTALHVGAKPLPPGIAKNLARGKPLPPGIAKRYSDPLVLPYLPRVDGHEWHQVGRDLVLVAIGTYLVVEILEAVFD